MNDYISISTLNDFIFCPYSIYLHNVYMETDETMYHATPQTQGRVAHESVDKKQPKKVQKTQIISTIVDAVIACFLSFVQKTQIISTIVDIRCRDGRYRRLEDSNNFYYCR